LLLVPALALTAASGAALAKGQQRGLVGAKAKRMPFITANGLLVILPSALFLAFKAHAGEIDKTFYAVQALELVGGATNLGLLGLSMRDGIAATAWKRGSFLRAAPTRAVRVLGTEEIAKGTLALRLEKPNSFSYRAGQAVYVTLNDPAKSDEKGRIRTFSIASAPHERELLVATRIGESTFKRALKGLGDGAKLEIEGPYGDLHADAERPAVFLAGGIGITPFRSMILDAVERGLRNRLVLFYSNRVPESAAFLAELSALQKGHPRFELVATMTDVAPGGADWTGERGAITREMLARHVGDLAAPVYYVAGPPPMVAAMETLLRDAGVKSADVHAEMFTGY
jgi:ferredoxin-NADP reductase